MNKKKQIEENVRRLKSKGIDPIELSRNINTIAFLSDIMEGRARNIEGMLRKAGEFKFSDELYVKNIAHYSGFMQKSVSRSLGPETAEGFGDMCDFIDEVIELAGSVTSEDQKLKIISTLKLIVK